MNEQTRIGCAVQVDKRELTLNNDARLWSMRSQSVGSVVGVSKGRSDALFSWIAASHFLSFQPGPLTRVSGLRILVDCDVCTTHFGLKGAVP